MFKKIKKITKTKKSAYLFSITVININKTLKLKKKADINKKFPNKLKTFYYFFTRKIKNFLFPYQKGFDYEINL